MADTVQHAASTDALLPLYQGAADPDVIAYLADHDHLIPFLIEARPNIDRHFPGADVWLEVSADPETDSVPKLLAAIAPIVEPAELVAQVTAFSRGWWYNHFTQARESLEIIVQYRENRA